MAGWRHRHLRVVAQDEERDPRDPAVWQPGLAAARDALVASRNPAPAPTPPVELDPALHELREPAEVLVGRALEGWPDVEACRSALEALLELAERGRRVSVARAAKRALDELGDVDEPEGGDA